MSTRAERKVARKERRAIRRAKVGKFFRSLGRALFGFGKQVGSEIGKAKAKEGMGKIADKIKKKI